MSSHRQSLGKLGEEEAIRILTVKNFKIICRNYQTPYGELDIVARDGETLVFVEVKSRIGNAYGGGLEAVTRQKRRHLTRAALLFLNRLQLRHQACRFDVLALEFSAGGVLKRHTHISGAFGMEGGNYYS